MATGKKTEITAVRLINTKGGSSLVEYLDNDIRRRVFVPAESVHDGTVSSVILSRAIPHSYPWEEMHFEIGGALLAEQLHSQDIWTIEDVLKNPKKLRTALNAVITSQLSEILTIAHGEKKGVNEHDSR